MAPSTIAIPSTLWRTRVFPSAVALELSIGAGRENRNPPQTLSMLNSAHDDGRETTGARDRTGISKGRRHLRVGARTGVPAGAGGRGRSRVGDPRQRGGGGGGRGGAGVGPGGR